MVRIKPIIAVEKIEIVEDVVEPGANIRSMRKREADVHLSVPPASPTKKVRVPKMSKQSTVANSTTGTRKTAITEEAEVENSTPNTDLKLKVRRSHIRTRARKSFVPPKDDIKVAAGKPSLKMRVRKSMVRSLARKSLAVVPGSKRGKGVTFRSTPSVKKGINDAVHASDEDAEPEEENVNNSLVVNVTKRKQTGRKKVVNVVASADTNVDESDTETEITKKTAKRNASKAKDVKRAAGPGMSGKDGEGASAEAAGIDVNRTFTIEKKPAAASKSKSKVKGEGASAEAAGIDVNSTFTIEKKPAAASKSKSKVKKTAAAVPLKPDEALLSDDELIAEPKQVQKKKIVKPVTTKKMKSLPETIDEDLQSDEEIAPKPASVKISKKANKKTVLKPDSQDDSDDEQHALKKDEIVIPLKGRHMEFNQMLDWIASSIANKDPLSVYVSGTPGTGKTATTSLVLASLGESVHSTIVNCVPIKSQAELLRSIFESQEIETRPTAPNFMAYLKDLEKPMILVLDEIDHLMSKTNSLLYAAFQWPQNMSSKLIVIGIANSIDLTERNLPKLKLSNPPKSLVFEPYTTDMIVTILKDKIREEDSESKIDAKALELCARKVASVAGDLRAAMQVVKQTMANAAVSGAETAGGVRDVMGVLNGMYSSALSRANLPMQPKLLLTVCLTMSSNKKTALTRSLLFSAYAKACKTLNVPALDSDELLVAFHTLESQSFVSVAKNGKIQLQVDTNTAKAVISNNSWIDQITALKL